MNNIYMDTKRIKIDKDKTIYLYDMENINYIIDIENSSKLIIYHYVVDTSINIKINLNSEYANIEYHYSVINYHDNNFKIDVCHNKKNTTSNIYNHGVNVLENKLHFEVVGIVPKNISGCVCNQENQIINIKNGNSTILPILLIDNYDVSSSHSAYIGKFRDDSIFYLMSRGIEYNTAFKLLVKSILLSNDNNSEELKRFKEKINEI